MSSKDQWLLPEGIEELLPPQAWRLELARRALLDLFARWGYALILPPFIEYLETLLNGTGSDLDLKTFKMTDQLSGRMLGVRADMTPQAARIDAHPLRREAPNRLCYLGTVLHTRGDGFGGTRSPLQIGAELFGHAGVESDVEILLLLLESLALLEIRDVHVSLGHVGIFRGLAREAGLSPVQENDLFEALQRKAFPEIGELLSASVADSGQRARLLALSNLNGGSEVLPRARELLAGAGPEVRQALDNLAGIASSLEAQASGVRLDFDLAEMRGYRYQTGMVFAVYVPGSGKEIARGGRYDSVAAISGRDRPATGFSTDLKTLMELSGRDFDGHIGAIYAPAGQDAGLAAAISSLRASGESVIRALPGQHGTAADMGCERVLARQGDDWVVIPA